MGEAMAGRYIRGEVVRWYLPVSMVDERALYTRAGVWMVAHVRGVAMGRSTVQLGHTHRQCGSGAGGSGASTPSAERQAASCKWTRGGVSSAGKACGGGTGQVAEGTDWGEGGVGSKGEGSTSKELAHERGAVGVLY